MSTGAACAPRTARISRASAIPCIRSGNQEVATSKGRSIQVPRRESLYPGRACPIARSGASAGDDCWHCRRRSEHACWRRDRPRLRPEPSRGSGAGPGASTTAGTNLAGASAAAFSARRASRRHLNSCSRADTTAPGTSVSSRTRALSSADHRRRPSAPVITSKRRGDRSGSSVSSNPDTKRSSIRDRQPVKLDRFAT